MNPAEAKLLIETLCRHFVRETGICTNLLPATGPVAGGGDQGRDFESLRGERDGRKLVFACTLTVEDRLPGKIRSDIREIVAGGPVDERPVEASVLIKGAHLYELLYRRTVETESG